MQCCRLKTVRVLAQAGNQVPQSSIILGGNDAQETQTAFSNDVLFSRRNAVAHPQRLWRGFILVVVFFTPSAGTPVKGGTWTDDLYEEPSSLIPNGSSETFSDLVDTTIYAPLFLGNVKGNITPGIVTELPYDRQRWYQPDLKTWTFHLQARPQVV